MDKKISATVLILILLGSAGCIQGESGDVIDDVIDDVIPDSWAENLPPWIDLGSRERTSPHLNNFDSCEELELATKNNLKQMYETQLLTYAYSGYSWWGGGMFAEDVALMDGAVAETAVAETSNAGGSAPVTSSADERVNGEDFSGTNNQEQGVDEADFVKTDGDNIYVIQDGHLIILGIPVFGEVTYHSNLSIEGVVTEMLMVSDGNNGTDDKLIIISRVQMWNMYWNGDSNLWDFLKNDVGSYEWDSQRVYDLTKFTVINVTNRSAPEVVSEVYAEGGYTTARSVNGVIRTVLHGHINIAGVKNWVQIDDSVSNHYYSLDWDSDERIAIFDESANLTVAKNNEIIDSLALSDMLPRIYVKSGNAVEILDTTKGGCVDYIAPSDSVSNEFTSIVTLDLLGIENEEDALDYSATHLMGNWPQVYSSQNMLIITEPAQNWWWYWGAEEMDEATNIHSFSLTDDGVEYVASGRINGTILDQFSISEHNDFIRVATTTGQWNRGWLSEQEPMENHIVVLKNIEGTNDLEIVGQLDGIALDERIWSARFVEDRAYLVTFRQIDPLWTIDLSDPTNPTIMGELEIPGVSTYIHPINDDYLLSIGMGPGEDGLGLDWSKTQVSLFDVSDFTNPIRKDVLTLSAVEDNENEYQWSWSSSQATYEHKAFQYWQEKDLLSVPLTTNGWKYDEVEIDGKIYYHSSYEYRSLAIIVDVDLEEGLAIKGNVNHSMFYDAENCRYCYSSGISRTIFMGDYVYTISGGGIAVHNSSSLELTDYEEFDYWETYHSYYYYDEVVIVEPTEGEAESDDSDSSSGTESGGSGGSTSNNP